MSVTELNILLYNIDVVTSSFRTEQFGLKVFISYAYTTEVFFFIHN